MSFETDTHLLAGQLRIAAFSLAAFDLLQTVRKEFKLYKESPSSIVKLSLFGAARYGGALALVLNGIYYFGSWSESSCKKGHLLPGIFQFLAGAASQGVFFYRTLVTSARNRNTFAMLTFLSITLLPLQAIAVTFNRQPVVFNSPMSTRVGCVSIVPEGRFNAGPIFYLAHLGFDVFAIVLSLYHIYETRQGKTLGCISRSIFKAGIAYMVLDLILNLLTFLASLGVNGITDIGSVFAILVAMYAAQHIGLKCSTLTEAQKTDNEFTLPANYQTAPSTPSFAAHIHERSATMTSIDPASGLHCAVGRHALKYRPDGDREMFFREATSATAASDPPKPFSSAQF